MQHAPQREQETAEVETWSSQDDGVEELQDHDLLSCQSAAPLLKRSLTTNATPDLLQMLEDARKRVVMRRQFRLSRRVEQESLLWCDKRSQHKCIPSVAFDSG